MDRYKVLLCDVGNVVLKLDDRLGRRKLLKLKSGPVTHGSMQVFEDEMWKKYGLGQATDAEFYAHVRAQFGFSASDQVIDDAASNVFTPIKETIELLGRLRNAGKRVIALSNGEPCRVRWQKVNGFYSLFDHYIVSCEVGLMKPDPAIYEHALRMAEVTAEEVLFVDDVLEHVTAAQKLGITSHQFKDAAGFRVFLHGNGLDV